MPVEAFASGDKSGWRYSWDLFYDERQQAAAAARALASVPGTKKTVALFTDNEPDSEVERPLYQAAFQADGLDLVGDYTFAVGTTNFSSFIAEARAKGADLVAGQLAPADGAALWKQLKSSAFRPKAAFLIDASDGGPVGRRWASWPRTPCRRATGAPARLRRTTRRHRPHARQEVRGHLELRHGGRRLRGGRGADRRHRQGRKRDPGQINAAISHTDAPTTAGPIRFDLATHTATTAYDVTR